jgi:carboxyl-terminal processing protease
MCFRLLLLLLLLATVRCEPKPPQLTPKDARVKIEEILKAHAAYQKLTPELVQRALLNYLEELDPGKTYFLAKDVDAWIHPSEELLQKALEGYHKEDFSTFEEIHQTMIAAVERRNELEKIAADTPLPKDVQASEFKSLTWAEGKEQLLERIVRIKALQANTAAKIDPETCQQFLQRLSKRRAKREEEILASSPAERKKTVLANVLKATSSALDSQTAYFTPAEANQFMIQVQQRLFGIGAQLRDDLNGFSVVRILEGSPASLPSKLKNGDKIIAVNHEPVVGMEITEAVELIRGPQGTPVVLTVLRETGEDLEKKEEKLSIEIIRGEVVLKETRLETSFEPYGDGVIGILHLFSFYQDSNTSSTSDLQEAIAALKKEHNLKGILLDLRDNAGGLLPQAVTVTGLFIKKGVVVSVKDNTQHIQHLRTMEGKPVWDGPLLVLTNRGSASAAEIVAQTLQDYGRALVVGDPSTYGKGTFQTFTLEAGNYAKVNPKGEYKVTRGRYYTVSGKSPQLVGVQSDIVVPGILSEMELGERYSKYPLETDVIVASFEDDLLDVPPTHRERIKRAYRHGAQSVLDLYQPYIGTLRANSAIRIQENKNYQRFLTELSKKDAPLSDALDAYGQSDLQQTEALNIMKDLIFLMKERTALAQAA